MLGTVLGTVNGEHRGPLEQSREDSHNRAWEVLQRDEHREEGWPAEIMGNLSRLAWR